MQQSITFQMPVAKKLFHSSSRVLLTIDCPLVPWTRRSPSVFSRSIPAGFLPQSSLPEKAVNNEFGRLGAGTQDLSTARSRDSIPVVSLSSSAGIQGSRRSVPLTSAEG